jgi:hypothetical protein
MPMMSSSKQSPSTTKRTEHDRRFYFFLEVGAHAVVEFVGEVLVNDFRLPSEDRLRYFIHPENRMPKVLTKIKAERKTLKGLRVKVTRTKAEAHVFGDIFEVLPP